MNNRKQQINSLLNSITEKELDEYISANNIQNKGNIRKLKSIRNSKPYNHNNTIGEKIYDDLNKPIMEYYKLGQAQIIAFVLECFYDNKYKIADLKTYLKAIMDKDETLKEYVYELMKDY